MLSCANAQTGPQHLRPRKSVAKQPPIQRRVNAFPQWIYILDTCYHIALFI